MKDKICLITGGARGLGEAIARRFRADGASLMLCDTNGEAAAALAAELDPAGRSVLWHRTDVTSETEVQAAVDAALAHFGRIDVLVNVAGILKHMPIDQMSLEVFESVVRVNLTGTFLCCRAVVPAMKKRGGGKIVNIASLGGRTGARARVESTTPRRRRASSVLPRPLPGELGPSGIYANAIAPGPILTELTKQVGPEVFAKWNAGRAVNKDGLPQDVAEAALFLASDRSDWITGVTLDVNGGILIP